jgi:hypothetical protein
LPQSLLGNVYNEVAAGIVQAHLNVPYGQLMGQDSGEASDSQDSGLSRGTLTRGEPRTFRHVPAPIRGILRGARSKYPVVTIADLMAAAHEPPLQYSQVKLVPNGSCLDYLCFGDCKSSSCTYKHVATAAVTAARAEAVAPKLGAAYSAYDAAQG